MAHIFDEKMMKKLDSPERRKEMPPLETLRRFGLREGEIAADIGCGIGFFSLSAAQIVGPSGRVYAFDISEAMLEELTSRAKKEGILNLEALLSTQYEFPVEDEAVDFCIVANVLHEVDDRERLLGAIGRMLRPGGKLAVIEWKKLNMEQGPPLEVRVSQDELEGLLTACGFEMTNAGEISERFYWFTVMKSLD